MRLSLISLTVLGVAVAGLYGLGRQPGLDSAAMAKSAMSSSSPHANHTPVQTTLAGKTERIVAQLLHPEREAHAMPGPSSLVIAQAQPEPAPATPPPPGEPSANQQSATEPQDQEPVVDESALRYFAARGDTARLQAEISRLRALYPRWKPPEDPLAVRANPDRQLEDMWQLYSQSRYADVRTAIAERQAAEPGWQPPEDLLERLKIAEGRAALVAASDARNYDAVVQRAAENPTLLTCSEVDVLWRVAEAFAKTDRQGRARDAYVYILNNCDNASERYATVQKAIELLPLDMLEELLAKEHISPAGEPEFEKLRDDIARRLVADGNADPKLVVPDKYVTRLERLAETNGMVSDAQLLGWYYYRRDDLGRAERWFRRVLAKEETASAAEGLALTLIARKSPLEAESVLYRWRDSSQGAKDAYLAAVANLLALDPPPVLQDEILRRMAPVVISARNADAAQQFGWYARAMRQLETAAEWFGAALAWRPDDEAAAYGLALTRNDLGDRAEVAELQRKWAGRSERIARLNESETERETPRGRQAAPRSAPQPARKVARTIARTAVQTTVVSRSSQCWSTLDPRQISPDAALARGWCLMEVNRPMEAVRFFDVAYASSSADVRSDAAYGKSLAYLRVGLTDKASVAAADAPQTNARAVELQSAILANRAVNAFKLGRYREVLLTLDQRAQIAPEQTDLMALRGYAHLNLGRLADARRIFQALADVGDKAGQRGLADIGAMN